MPIKIQSDLPVKEILERENIFVMDEKRAVHQDIRPIQILILNLMPLKDRASASPVAVKHPPSGGCDIYGSGEPSGKKYIPQSSEQVLPDFFRAERYEI